ncbi:MAG: hypothetical protein Ct9H300mP18_04530 [Candidatus Neomarinimicrobiota bacterium]|nr:MAG: hypothetical protein Ct9H300mP18_04530 [Candidatus Neomarinimicrobiota bacterium]
MWYRHERGARIYDGQMKFINWQQQNKFSKLMSQKPDTIPVRPEESLDQEKLCIS